MKKFRGFTLAEVLITLVIIGVVAVFVIPVVIQKHNNLVVEGRLAKFYRNINAAIQLSELENGDRTIWSASNNMIEFEYDEEGNPIKGSSSIEKWWNYYIAPYMSTLKIEYKESGCPVFYFADGSALEPECDQEYSSTADWFFYPGDPESCKKRYNNDYSKLSGVCGFSFIYFPDCESKYSGTPKEINCKYLPNTFEPYKWGWDGTTKGLTSTQQGYSCLSDSENNIRKRSYCATLIQSAGWKITKDYPLNVNY